MKNIYILTLILTSFIFSEGDDKLIDNSLCRTITKDVDKFSGEMTFRTPIYDKFVREQLVFTKHVVGDSIVLYLYIIVPSHSLFVDEETTLLLLDNGKKIQWNNSINVEYYEDDFYDWIYSSFVTLDKEKIDLLLEHTITDVKLGIFDSSIRKPKEYQSYLECILDL